MSARRRARDRSLRQATVAAVALAGLAPVAAPATVVGPGTRTGARPGCETPASDPSDLADLHGTLFFTANDGVHGDELWRSDGTRKGTVLVKDIDPARNAEYGAACLTTVGSTLFFAADDGVHGTELWRSDGTRKGTVLVRDVNPDTRGAYDGGGPGLLLAVGRTVFFTVDDGVHGEELWRSDGTRKGTVLVKDIHQGSDYDYYGGPRDLTAVGGRLFFTADDGVHGRELWTSDGTRAGTELVRDIDPDREGYNRGPSGLTAVRGRLFFTADDGVHGDELWRSDGTRAGTVMVKDIDPDPLNRYSDSPLSLRDVGGTLFFAGDDGTHGRELWKSDGTAAGTVMVEDVHPGGYDGASGDLAGVAGTVFFPATDGTHGPELWRSDGTAAGTRLVRDINPRVKSEGPSYLAGVGGTVFFTADDGVHGRELWASDGTAAGTVMVKDISPAVEDSYYDYTPYDLTDVGGRLFFTVDDGIHGRELWTSDGTAAGTVRVEDINRGAGFRVAAKARANTRTGVVRLRVRAQAAGELVVGPARGSLVRTVTKDVGSGGRTEVRLEPTAKGLRRLEKALRRAHREGKKVGRVEVDVRFAFTSCAGGTSSETRRFTLKLR